MALGDEPMKFQTAYSWWGNRHMLPFHALNYDSMQPLNVLSVQKYLKGSL